jgi:predicted MFS family arabinose efflux permease
VSRILEVVAPARLGSSFRWLLGASWLTSVADGFVLAAGPLLVASQTSSPALVAAAVFLQRLPWLLFGLYAGVVADRANRRTIMIVTNLVRALVLLLLSVCILTGWIDVPVVLAALFVLGINDTFNETTSSTLMPMLVADDDLGIANARSYFGLIMGNSLIGPPIGAGLFAAGMALPFLSELVCVLAGAALLTRVRLPALPSRTEGPDPQQLRAREEISAGWRWLWSHAAVRTLAITIFAFNITYGAAWSVLVLYSRERLHLGEIGFGLISTAIAIGGLVGTASYGRLERRFALGSIMRVCLLLETVTHLALALIHWAWPAMAVFFVFGAYAFVWGTTSTSVRQRAVPAEFQGRVGSVYLIGLFGGLVIGAALGGGIAQVWGITAPFWFAFVGSAAILAWIWRALPSIAHAEPS